MCNQPAKYARFTEPGSERGTVRELAELAEERKNKSGEWLTHICEDKIPKTGPTRVEFACRDCFILKGWPYELR